jgi:hypothetical protein
MLIRMLSTSPVRREEERVGSAWTGSGVHSSMAASSLLSSSMSTSHSSASTPPSSFSSSGSASPLAPPAGSRRSEVSGSVSEVTIWRMVSPRALR